LHVQFFWLNPGRQDFLIFFWFYKSSRKGIIFQVLMLILPVYFILNKFYFPSCEFFKEFYQ
jgi:hypothetical protein